MSEVCMNACTFMYCVLYAVEMCKILMVALGVVVLKHQHYVYTMR